jgi:mannose-6-phosphate isomerase-like protein (cupin superfamily)
MTIDPHEVLRTWRARGFDGGVWIDAPGQEWTDFVHDGDELLMLVEGELDLEVVDTPIHPRVGEEILIPAGATHTVRNVGGTTARWLYAYRRS